ncbi:hypothetical protein QUB47_12300 [Microcoleus sp. AT9_B5]
MEEEENGVILFSIFDFRFSIKELLIPKGFEYNLEFHSFWELVSLAIAQIAQLLNKTAGQA